ncbi:MAG TPA: efflux RND transporter periplasmic adaptor subunit, partial [Haliangium sp.]|nr:efflux RND transporter periplasmic adaptor subunit [Haliangium sp.]
GVPESQCLTCNPDLTFATPAAPQDWCKEHGVPESKCTKCNPRLVAKFIAAGDYCREHGFPASVCPICHPELVAAAGQEPPVFPAPGTRVRLASAETAREAGIETYRVERRPFARTLEVVGQLGFDRNRHAQLSARGEALVLGVHVDVGDEVKAGQALVMLASSSVGAEQARLSAARTRLDTARSALERQRELSASGVGPRKNEEEAQRELAAAQAEYDTARAALYASGATMGGTGGRHALAAPFAGTIVARDAVSGKTATPEQVLIEVADLSTMWAQLDVPEADASQVRPGQQVRITLEGMRGETRTGTIARVGARVDPQSRTVPARVELPNPDRGLKAGVFLRATIEVAAEHEALLVPRPALQHAEGRTLVFVKKEDGLYEPVAVELGASDADMVEVTKGLSPGAEVVTTAAFLLKTEILKGSIGAGCCEEGAGE